MMLLFTLGYYNESKPVFHTSDFSIEINNNRINNMYVHKDLYDKLELVDNFTLSPVLTFQDYETNNFFVGVQDYIREPLDGKGYGFINAQMVNAPFIETAPLVFECKITNRKKDVLTYISAEIMNVIAYSSIVNNGEVDIKKLFGLRGLGSSTS